MLNKLLTALLTCACAALPASAQEFPTRQPIKIVVTVPAGGLTDALARFSAEFLQKHLGQTVVVENRPGASSTIGVNAVARATADGYTLLFIGSELSVVPAVRRVPYQLEDLTYLVQPFSVMPIIIARPNAPFSTTAELVAYMKEHPGKVTYGSTGVGAINHMGTITFESSAGVQGLHVPYAGIAPVFNDLMADLIDFTYGGITPFPEGKGLKVLGSSGSRRHPLFPDLPTPQELGITNAAMDLWYLFAAPPNLPQPIADQLTTALTAMTQEPGFIAKLEAATGFKPEAQPLTGEALKRMVIEQESYWKDVARRENIPSQE